MEERNENQLDEEIVLEEEINEDWQDSEKPLDRNIKLMSPGKMVARRFFRSKLSIIGLIMIVALMLFSWCGPLIYNADTFGWGETDIDTSPFIEYDQRQVTYIDETGETVTFYLIVETSRPISTKQYPNSNHILGTDVVGMDILARLMAGGRVSLAIGFISVFAVMFIGVIFGGIAGYFGGKIDSIIMRICDILMCLPGMPILLILSSVLSSWGVDGQYRIYFLMLFLTVFSWSGTARLVRGQILSLREQEYMVAAEAMGFSVSRKIFKHLIPNVLPQLIVSMTLSLGSMILYEASLSYLGLGVLAPYASWGSMINAASDPDILANYFHIWGPPGICIIIAVLGFNFVGDGLRDALDPKMRR